MVAFSCCCIFESSQTFLDGALNLTKIWGNNVIDFAPRCKIFKYSLQASLFNSQQKTTRNYRTSVQHFPTK